MMNEIRIALLGQPNSGKSTVFNMLTGAHQHVGNWPGKTVEKVEGTFVRKDTKYLVADLPGTYSLSANSDEEIVTRDHIANGSAQLVCILADASQLERSLFMLSDYAGIRTPAMLVLTMMDVAKSQGRQIDEKRLSEKLGIPVMTLVATEKKDYARFFATLEEAIAHPRSLQADALERLYGSGTRAGDYADAKRLVPEDGMGQYSAQWLATKLLEGDQVVAAQVDAAQGSSAAQAFVQNTKDGSLYTSDCKFAWIGSLLDDTVKRPKTTAGLLTRFDRIAISGRWGKPLAIGIVLLAIVAAMCVAAPLMGVGGRIPAVLGAFVESTGMPKIAASFINSTVVTALGWVFSMAGFVFGINLVFGFIEEVGYMARVSYVFDNTMNRLGLQGKSVMPMLVSFGCTIGGAAGTRVIDSYGQRVLTIALAWAIPCGATFAVVPTLAGAFFGGGGAVLVLLLIFAIMFVHIMITAKLFGRTLSPVGERTGLIMELPPYHKPRWKNLLRSTLVRVWDVFRKAFVVVVVVAAVFWVLSYSAGDDPSGSILYRFGVMIEPVTRFFGMGWQTFIAFLASMISKEASLGVTGVLFSGAGSILDATTSGAVDSGAVALMTASIPKPEALAFIVALNFNVPCLMALSATAHETHSVKWTLRIALYYFVTALILSCLVYHAAVLFF